MFFLGGIGNLFDHCLELRSSVASIALCMGLLEKPQLLKSDYCVALGEFKIELHSELVSSRSTLKVAALRFSPDLLN